MECVRLGAPKDNRCLRWRGSSVLALCISIFLFLSSALAQTSQIVGEWRFIIAGEQPWTISTFDPSTGAITGFGAANGFEWTFTGTAISGTFSINYIYTNLPSYFGTLTATFTDSCTLGSGTWTSSFGQMGSWTGSKVNCSGSGGPGQGELKPTGISLFCNRSGPGLSQASCAATVADAGGLPRASPSGSVEFVASGGFLPGAASCLLQPTAFSPGVASCTAFFQVPDGFPIATPFPIEAAYEGDATFEAAATSHELIQAGCIGTPEAPCPGAVSLSFVDVPQIIDGVLSSVVACGGSITGSAHRGFVNSALLAAEGEIGGSCSVDLEASLTAAKEVANIEEQERLQEFADQLEQTSTRSLSTLEAAFIKALSRTAQSMATNQEVYESHLRNAAQVAQTIRQEMREILTNSPSPLLSAGHARRSKRAKSRIKIPALALSAREGQVKANKQRKFTQRASKLTKPILSALKEAGVGTVEIKLSLQSVRSGKLPRGVKRKAKTSEDISVGLTSLR